jgi:hypothetical protein
MTYILGDPYDPQLALSKGDITNSKMLTIWGYGKVLTSAGVINSLEVQNTAWTPITTAETWEVLSSVSTDGSAGTGAREVTIYGIDNTGAYATEVETLNGTTAVSLSTSWLAFNSVIVTDTGSNNTNNGIITVRVASGGDDRGKIQAGCGQSNQCIYRAPSNRQLFLKKLTCTALDHGVSYTIKIWCYDTTTELKKLMTMFKWADQSDKLEIDLGYIEIGYGNEIALEVFYTGAGGAVNFYASILANETD